MLFDTSMRIWMTAATLVCNGCGMAEVYSLTQSMLADMLRYGHVCQLCVDETIIIHSRLH